MDGGDELLHIIRRLEGELLFDNADRVGDGKVKGLKVGGRLECKQRSVVPRRSEDLVDELGSLDGGERRDASDLGLRSC